MYKLRLPTSYYSHVRHNQTKFVLEDAEVIPPTDLKISVSPAHYNLTRLHKAHIQFRANEKFRKHNITFELS